MAARFAHRSVTSELFATLLFTFITIIGFSYKTNAQGWGFTMTVTVSGPCGAYAPIIPVFPIPNVIPTQGQCEAIRQQVLAIKTPPEPMFDAHGNYLGDCYAFTVCTPCSGSDIVTPGQVNPGDVSFDGQFSGRPLFTPHESSAFEDWANDYKQQLEAFGIKSIIDNTLTSMKFPSTGDKDFDAYYANLSNNFNPTTPPVKPPAVDASVVDLSNKKGVVTDNSEISYKPLPIMGGSPLTAEEKERQNFGPTYIDQANMFTNLTDGEINKNGDDHPLIDLSREIGVTAAGWLPDGAGYVGIAAVNIWAENAKSIKDVWDGKTCSTTETMLNNAFENTKKDIKEKAIGDVKEKGVDYLSEKAYGQELGGAVSKSFKVYNYGKDVSGIYNKIKEYNWKYGSNNGGN